MVIALGVAWVLDGLEITIAANVVADLTQKNTLNLSAGQAADIATWYLSVRSSGRCSSGACRTSWAGATCS